MIILMGAAGAGKGTQGHLLQQETGYDYVSTGEILRELATPVQQERMLTGELLDDDEIFKIVDEALTAASDPNRVILDGFPRTVRQADWLLQQVAAGRFAKPCVINLEVSEAVMHDRLASRGRQDDAEAVIRHRFQNYQDVTTPVLKQLKAAGVDILDINADEAPEAVRKAVRTALKERL